MENDFVKYFNKEENFWTNQQVLEMREVLRGIMAKDWVEILVESMCFTQHDKLLSKNSMEFYSECWNNRCVVLHSPVIRKQCLRKETKAIKLEAMNVTIENQNRHANACPINEESETLESMSTWIKKVRVLEQTLEIVDSNA